MAKHKSNRDPSEYRCKPHKVPYLKSGFHERVCEVSGKQLGWNDASKKLKCHTKTARMRSKHTLRSQMNDPE